MTGMREKLPLIFLRDSDSDLLGCEHDEKYEKYEAYDVEKCVEWQTICSKLNAQSR